MTTPLSVSAPAQRFAALEQGEGPELALCLHGFPDHAPSMAGLAGALAAEGYRAVAPFLPGYGASDPAPGGDYTLAALGQSVIALADALGHERFIVVGHDWGAAIGYTIASLAPDRLRALVTLAVPPVAVFAQNLRRHPLQVLRSWYMLFFQAPRLAEQALLADDFALIDRLWEGWSPGWRLPAEEMAALKETFRSPGTVAAALAYYRALVHGAVTHPASFHQTLQLSLARIAVPTLVIAGRNDGCIGVEQFEGLEAAFAGPWEHATIDGAGHFMHLERPALVAERALQFLGLKGAIRG